MVIAREIKKVRRLKDKEHTAGIIKISKIRECCKESRGCYSFKGKLICVKITKPTTITSTCFPDTKKGRKELLKFIKEELYL